MTVLSSIILIYALLNSSIEVALATQYLIRQLTFSTLGLSVGQFGLQR